MRKILVLAAAIMLSGCAHHPLDCELDFVPHDDCLPGTGGYDSAQKRQEQAAVTMQLQQQNDDATCKSYGTKFGTPEYAQCREQLLSIRSNQQIADDNLKAQKKAAAAAYIMQQNAQPTPTYVTPPPKSSNTTCTGMGNSISCQTYGN